MTDDTSDSDTETVEACPECNAAAVRTRNPNGPVLNNSQADPYRCNRCHATFEEPVMRPRQGRTPNFRKDSAARTLDDLDPEDVPATGGATSGD